MRRLGILVIGLCISVGFAQKPSTGVFYFHSNHIGSTQFVTDEEGVPQGDWTYLPYGQPMEEHCHGLDHTRYRFTGKEMDGGSGLYFFETRYYDGELGRFLKPDSGLGSQQQHAAALNRFAYTGGNPISLTDLTGRSFDSEKLELPPSEDSGTPVVPTVKLTSDSMLSPPVTEEDSPLQAALRENRDVGAFSPDPDLVPLENYLAAIDDEDKRLWLSTALHTLWEAGPDSQHAVQTLIDQDVQIEVRRFYGITGSMRMRWTTGGDIHLRKDNEKTWEGANPDPTDFLLLSGIAHEARHLEQGFSLATSVEGEVQAWALELSVSRELGVERGWPQDLKDALANYQNDPSLEHIRAAEREMQDLAGPFYFLWVYPTQPIRPGGAPQ